MPQLDLSPVHQARLNDEVTEAYGRRFHEDAVVEKSSGYIYCGSLYLGRLGWNFDKACWSFTGIKFDRRIAA